jgi:hypothetical protein
VTTNGTRAWLKTRLEKLADLYSWGDFSESEYRRQKATVDAELAKLPVNDELILFDRHRAVIRSLGDSLAVAPGEKRQELVASLVERVETTEQEVVRVVRTPPARPFFASAAAESERGEDFAATPVWRPRTDSNRRRRP